MSQSHTIRKHTRQTPSGDLSVKLCRVYDPDTDETHWTLFVSRPNSPTKVSPYFTLSGALDAYNKVIA